MKSLPGWGKLALTTNTHQQSCFPSSEESPWAWAIDLQVAKDVKERISATSLVPTVFLRHSESCGYALRMKYPFCSLYPIFRVYQCSVHSLISESSQSQNIQIFFCSTQPDLSLWEVPLSPKTSFIIFLLMTPKSSLPQTNSLWLSFTSLILPHWHLAAPSYQLARTDLFPSLCPLHSPSLSSVQNFYSLDLLHPPHSQQPYLQLHAHFFWNYSIAVLSHAGQASERFGFLLRLCDVSCLPSSGFEARWQPR